jgi:hypothetical protein
MEMRIICLSERYITFLADKLGLGGVVLGTKHVIPIGIHNDHCNRALYGDKKKTFQYVLKCVSSLQLHE